MIQHLVLFRMRPDASADAVNEMLHRLNRLRDEVPGVLRLSCGANFCSRAKGYTHGLAVEFDSPEALEAYQVHSAHQAALSEAIRPVVEADGILALDYEF